MSNARYVSIALWPRVHSCDEVTRRRTQVIPSARRLIKSLRDLGYDLATAVADLVDNSIAAGATNISVETCFDGDESWIRVVDDGGGMTLRQLREAMRFGTRRNYATDDLGKFGLGLKAASLSQCRCLTVASRTTVAGRIVIAQWDLDYVEKTDRWEVLHPKVREVPLAAYPLRASTGTVVLWKPLDRVFRYRIPDGKRAQNDFDRVTSDLAQHLSMVFHRFLGGEADRRLPLAITLNGVRLVPWDPFARKEIATVSLPQQKIRFVHDSIKHVVRVRAFLLPTEVLFSSASAHRAASGPGFWNRQQGFYIYRADRMIQSGGWNRLRTSDEHTKLARASIDLPAGAEELFELNISKTQVRIPTALRPSLAAVASQLTGAAQDAYRRRPAPSLQVTSRLGRNLDPKIRVLRALVRMVVVATQSILDEELADDPAKERIAARLLAAESRFAVDLEHEVSRERFVRLDPRPASQLAGEDLELRAEAEPRISHPLVRLAAAGRP